VIVQKVDGKDAGVRGTESHAYVLPGELTFLNEDQGNVVLEDRGTSYDPVCLDPRNYRDGKNC
jgi:hypothetical protein